MSQSKREAPVAVIVEPVESRRLLAFAPVGSAEVAQSGGATGIEALAGLASGTHVVVWTSNNNLVARVYDGSGNALTDPTQVNTGVNPVSNADVAMAGDGSFIVTWQSTDTAGAGIYARQFDAAGAPLAAPFQVNTTETGDQTNPTVGAATDGTATIVWQSNNGTADRIYQQRFNNIGGGVGSETLLGPDATATEPDVAVTGSGAYVVAWNSDASTLVQQFDSSGAAVGSEIIVAPDTGSHPSVGIATDGSFVVAWSRIDTGSEHDVVFQRYSSSGVAAGGVTVASSAAAGDENFAQVDLAGSGKFVVGWFEASTTPGTYNLIGFRAFSASGVAVADDAVISSVTPGPSADFGIIWRDGQPVRVAYLSGGNATVQGFADTTGRQFVVDLNDTGETIQFFGNGSTITIRRNGVTSSISTNDYDSIRVNGGAGDDYIRFKDLLLPVTVIGGAGNDSITTAEGNDYVEGGLGNDAISTGAGDDYMNGNDEQDSLFGGAGNDTLTGGPGRNLMYAEDGNDLMTGGNRPDTMYGGAGDDFMRGGEGGDGMFGGDGVDVIYGQGGFDGILGEDGNDYLTGNDGKDTVYGGAGDDSVYGDNDEDKLLGDDGADTLFGGLGGDTGYTDGLDILFSIEIVRQQ